jgi:hypothetical protein
MHSSVQRIGAVYKGVLWQTARSCAVAAVTWTVTAVLMVRLTHEVVCTMSAAIATHWDCRTYVNTRIEVSYKQYHVSMC